VKEKLQTKKHTIMCGYENCCGPYPWFIPLMICLAVWEMIWKLIAFWRSARNGHLAWFICIALFNTVGILPIIYILTHKSRKDTEKSKSEPAEA